MKYISILFVLLLTSCVNNNQAIDVYQVSLPRTEISRVVDIPVTFESIRIEPLVDTRTNNSISILNGKTLLSKSDLSEVVTSSVARTLETAGFRSSNSGEVVLIGEIRKFFSTFEGYMPSEGQAEVLISLGVKDSQNRRTYTAQYQGSAKLQTVFASAEDVSNTLESALESALRQMIKDRQLLSFLRMRGTGKSGSASYNTDLY